MKARLELLGTLTPGDFAAVRWRLLVLAQRPDAAGLLHELEAEIAAKQEPSRRAGFSATAAQGPHRAELAR